MNILYSKHFTLIYSSEVNTLDLLFINKPLDIIDMINKNIPFYFPDIQNSYSFNDPTNEVPVLEKVNTGVFYIPNQNFYNIEHIEFALSNLLKNGINYFPSCIEQSAYAHMFLKLGFKSLSEEKYS